MNMQTIMKPNPDFEAIKTKQNAAWSAGDYSKVGVTLQITGEQLCEAMDLRAGHSVLDIAAGNGNVTLAAARRFCRVGSVPSQAGALPSWHSGWTAPSVHWTGH